MKIKNPHLPTLQSFRIVLGNITLFFFLLGDFSSVDWHAPISVLQSLENVNFIPKNVLLGQRFSKCWYTTLSIACILKINWITSSPIAIKSRDKALILMNLINERGHMTNNFPEYTMTHIHGFDSIRGLCKCFYALRRPWETPKR